MMDIPDRLANVRKSGDGWTAKCPAHPDKENSLSVCHQDGKWLLHCHAGCTVDEITAALGIGIADLFDDRKGTGRKKRGEGGCQSLQKRLNTSTLPGRRRGGPNPSDNRATAQPSGLTVEQYANAKGLPLEFLRGCGLSDVTYESAPAVRIPYLGPGGEFLATRFRIALQGSKFRWKSGAKLHLYGLNRIEEARAAGQVVLVEGESDAHTLWLHGIPALGVPGAGNWREDRDAPHLEGIETIYVVIEPDSGGETVRKWLAQSAIRHRARIVTQANFFTAEPPARRIIGGPAFRLRSSSSGTGNGWRRRKLSRVFARAPGGRRERICGLFNFSGQKSACGDFLSTLFRTL